MLVFASTACEFTKRPQDRLFQRRVHTPDEALVERQLGCGLPSGQIGGNQFQQLLPELLYPVLDFRIKYLLAAGYLHDWPIQHYPVNNRKVSHVGVEQGKPVHVPGEVEAGASVARFVKSVLDQFTIQVVAAVGLVRHLDLAGQQRSFAAGPGDLQIVPTPPNVVLDRGAAERQVGTPLADPVDPTLDLSGESPLVNRHQ